MPDALDAEQAIAALGLGAPAPAPPTSALRFPDAGAYRIEIPSVEGADALDAVLTEADARGVLVHRVSQGSGVSMLSDAEIVSMLERCAAARVELCLFLGPRSAWETGSLAAAGGGPRARGRDQLRESVADAIRATRLGVRCLLVGDEGVLWTLHRMRAAGDLPLDLRLKVSALAAPLNPASFQVLEALGADSINVSPQLAVAQLAELRSAGGATIDFYVEAPDDLGGFVRHHAAAEVVRIAAPVYLKFGVRNAPALYPAGAHLRDTIVTTARERVRRAQVCLELVGSALADLPCSPPGAVEHVRLSRFATA